MTRELKITEISEEDAVENKFLDTVFCFNSKRPSSSSYVVLLIMSQKNYFIYHYMILKLNIYRISSKQISAPKPKPLKI